jgi:hypothetical protein
MSPPKASLKGFCVDQSDKQARKVAETSQNAAIAALLDEGESVQFKFPAAVAVARLRPSWDYNAGNQRFGLDTIDSLELDAWNRAVAGQHTVTDFRAIPPIIITEPCVDIRSLREASARLKCELLLVYAQDESSVDNFNDAAALYWTFIGIWLVPGDVVEHKAVAQAILIETRTGSILGTAVGTSYLKQIIPLAYRDITHDKLAKQTRTQALADMQAKSAVLLHKIAGTVATATMPAE